MKKEHVENEIQKLSPEQFPPLLSEIADPPKHLYVRGTSPNDTPNNMKFLCVVGSRKYSPYGKTVCEKLIAGLRGYNVGIISGLALGIDAIAHNSALDANLHTISVPGSGLGWDVLYPRSHNVLARRILESGGTLLSEYEEHTKAALYTFPQRNRIMAGLSHAVLVIEAEERSGTLITSRLATEYNRDVLTVPASILSPTSAGPHMLIRLGATPIRNSDDILEALHIEASVETKPNCATPSVAQLSENEQKIWKLLERPLARDELIQQLNLSIQEINVLLSIMEIKGLIHEQMGLLQKK